MKKIISSINKAYDAFDKVNELFIICLMAGMCLDLLLQVIFRYVFASPLKWSEELARYMFVWIALIGAAWCGRNHIHVRMTAVVSKFPENVQRWQQLFVAVVCATCCFYLFMPAIQIFMAQSKLKAVTLGISLGIQYIVAPVGILMLAVQQSVDALTILFDWDGYKTRFFKSE